MSKIMALILLSALYMISLPSHSVQLQQCPDESSIILSPGNPISVSLPKGWMEKGLSLYQHSGQTIENSHVRFLSATTQKILAGSTETTLDSCNYLLGDTVNSLLSISPVTPLKIKVSITSPANSQWQINKGTSGEPFLICGGIMEFGKKTASSCGW